MASALPRMGLGTWKAACGEVKQALKVAVRTGYRLIDCAAAYGNEKEIGDALNDVVSEVQNFTRFLVAMQYSFLLYVGHIPARNTKQQFTYMRTHARAYTGTLHFHRARSKEKIYLL